MKEPLRVIAGVALTTAVLVLTGAGVAIVLGGGVALLFGDWRPPLFVGGVALLAVGGTAGWSLAAWRKRRLARQGAIRGFDVVPVASPPPLPPSAPAGSEQPPGPAD